MTVGGLRERLPRLEIGTALMAIVAWATVIIGTYMVYPWYRDAILAAGIGCFVMGLVTTIAAANAAFSSAIAFVKPVGPLSGKSDIATAADFVSWLGSTWCGAKLR